MFSENRSRTRVKTGRRTAIKSALPVGAVIGFVVMMATGGLFGCSKSSSSELPPVPESELTTWMKQKAVESNGDFTKLSPEDQQKLQRATQNQGPQYMKMLLPKK